MESVAAFFETEGGKLTSFVYRLTQNVADTEDIVQDTLVTALEKFAQYQGRSSLKTWIFSIASNKAIDFLRREKRWGENVMDKAKAAAMHHPEIIEALAEITQGAHGSFEVREHIDLCFTCISKTLPIEQQVSLMLKDMYSFTVKEIAEIIDRTPAQVRHYLEDARAKMIEIYDRRCALINKKGTCHQCSELSGIFNPKATFQQKIMQVKFAREAEQKSKEELFDLRTDLVKAIDPLQAEGHKFQHKHMSFICQVAKDA